MNCLPGGEPGEAEIELERRCMELVEGLRIASSKHGIS